MLLRHYQPIFIEPVELPLRRTQNHKIPLLLGVGLISVRPYRYNFTQKNEMEKMVAEMLDGGHHTTK